MTQATSAKPLCRRVAVRSRDACYQIASVFDRLAGRDHVPALPPLHLRIYYYGTANPSAYTRACAGARAQLISRGLRPDHRVLDIGCGVGNLAAGLADYLRVATTALTFIVRRSSGVSGRSPPGIRRSAFTTRTSRAGPTSEEGSWRRPSSNSRCQPRASILCSWDRCSRIFSPGQSNRTRSRQVGSSRLVGLHIRDVRRGAWWRGGPHDQDVIAAERRSP
jgi:hypothetical protein